MTTGGQRVLFVAMAAAAALLLLKKAGPATPPENEEGIMDSIQTTMDEAAGAVMGAGPIDGMSTSPAMLDMLRRRERFVPTPYNLGDGGWTIGYGHFAKNRADLPDSMTEEEGQSQFADDVQNRGEKWVKLYVSVDLTQNQFDALVSVAFNMSPQSFKKFATAVNNGEGIDAIAQESVSWVSSKFTNGIQNRRNAEIDVFDSGVYA